LKLSVVILNYNVRFFLELCLNSVISATSNIDAEIIVVDNNSVDDSCEMVKRLFPGIKLIENKENLGFSKGNNIGVSHAIGEYICILNPDTLVAEDAFEIILKFADTKSDLGAVGCKLIDGVGVYLPESKRNVPYLKVAIKKLIGNSSKYYANHLEKDAIGTIDILVGAFMIMKSKTYREIGGFDEDYFMYGEDIDLSYKLLKEGYKNYYYGQVQTLHFKGESTLRDKTYAKRFYGAMQIFYNKHFTRNILFDLVVWFGIKTVSLVGNKSVKKNSKKQEYVLISDKVTKNLENVLQKEVALKDKIGDFNEATEVIFDTNFINYKDIISVMNKKSNIRGWTYKILPKNANFIIGSDNSVGKGEVINF